MEDNGAWSAMTDGMSETRMLRAGRWDSNCKICHVILHVLSKTNYNPITNQITSKVKTVKTSIYLLRVGVANLHSHCHSNVVVNQFWGPYFQVTVH